MPSDYKNCLTDNGSLIGFASLALHMDGVIKVSEEEGNMTEAWCNLDEQLQINTEELKTIFTGDVAFSFMDMSEKEVTIDLGEDWFEGTELDEELLTHKVPVMKAITVLGITDQAKVVKAFEGLGAKRNGDVYEMYSQYYVVLEDKVIWTSDIDIANKMAKDGELGPLKNGYEDMLSDNPICGFISLDWNSWPPMVTELAEMSMGRQERKGFKTFISKFEAVVFQGTWFSNELELKMTNTNQNALKTLLHSVDEAM